VVLGYKSSKHATKDLEAPKFWPEDAAAPAGAGGGLGGQIMTPGGPSGGGPSSTGSSDAPIGPSQLGMAGMMSGSGGRAAGGGPAAVLDANRRRYLEVTDQVRRLPVALVLVVDQMFIPDVLVAYSNSPFRFYTVQTHWRRFHGSLGTAQGGGTGGGAGFGALMGPPGGSDAPSRGGDVEGGPSVDGYAGQGLIGMYGGRGGMYGMFGR